MTPRARAALHRLTLAYGIPAPVTGRRATFTPARSRRSQRRALALAANPPRRPRHKKES